MSLSFDRFIISYAKSGIFPSPEFWGIVGDIFVTYIGTGIPEL